MLRCVPFADVDREAWDELARVRGTVFHTTAFREILLNSFGYQCGYHALVEGQERVRALIPLAIGRNLGMKRVAVSLPFVNHMDICADSADTRKGAMDAISSLRKRMGLYSVELRLKDQGCDRPGWQIFGQNYTFSLPLLESESETLGQASASCRNHVRKTYKNEWFSVSFTKNRLPDFYQVYVQRMKQLGSPAPSIDFFANFFRYLPDQSVLLTAADRSTKQVVGGMLLLADAGSSTFYYPFGAGKVEYNGRYLNNFMYWEAAKLGMRMGLKTLDLGRSPIGSGTYRYKLQWGARPEPLQYLFFANGAAAAGPPDRERLRFLIDFWKIVPGWIAAPVGRRLIRHVMP